ncbi:subtilisin-like protease SBT1.4 [Asparagus officinalis]|uniref:subtilisin-like protease SBT1.4 n=1 Tax=Asparagus officinalis TaxID=4686 RepID=UPI00098E80E5|nr:subtilisin-like protease SBT1.4 [Asparagus officinalis]
MIYSYENIISGFAAKLSERELLKLKKKSGLVHAHKDRTVPLHTTHTPNFLGLHRHTPGFWNDSNYGKGVIIGIFYTGVAPDHPSFHDEGMPRPPAKWKRECEFNASLSNNKLIGARNFAQGLKAMQSSAVKDGPYDNAIYKVCNEEECANSDILAGMDAAIEDGVDVMSLSPGSDAQPLDSDVIATASFAAIEKGIFVSCSAGNYGPAYGTVTNDAPWILTVGASTIDREIRTTVELGSKAWFNGESTYQPRGFKSNLLPLTDGSYCVNGSLSCVDVKGKVVLWDDGNNDWVEKGEVVKNARGTAMIIANHQGEGVTVPALSHVLPASHVSYTDGMNIRSYIYSNEQPKTTFTFEGTVLGIYISSSGGVGNLTPKSPNATETRYREQEQIPKLGFLK